MIWNTNQVRLGHKGMIRALLRSNWHIGWLDLADPGEDGGVIDALASFCIRELDAPANDHPVFRTRHNINYAQYAMAQYY
jgi:hypothetical protein